VIEFKLPELGENISQGDLVRLMIAPGASVSTGQAVMELETDKAVVEVPSSVSGTVQEIRVKEGEKIKVGQVIFTVENGAGAKAAEAKQSPQQSAAPPPDGTPRNDSQPKPEPSAAAAAPSRAPAPSIPITAATGAREFKLPDLGENFSLGDLVRLMFVPVFFFWEVLRVL
jgi:pyruvate dehydrogenase E2 component (dihydrolipoamide acetyltransferase)